MVATTVGRERSFLQWRLDGLLMSGMLLMLPLIASMAFSASLLSLNQKCPEDLLVPGQFELPFLFFFFLENSVLILDYFLKNMYWVYDQKI